jgi:hypothetical protein
MSKTEGQTFRDRFGNETKTFWYRSRISLIESRLFRFCPVSALLDQIERISFDGTNSGTNSFVFCFIPIRHRNVCETFAERLWNVCFFTVFTLLCGRGSKALGSKVRINRGETLYPCKGGIRPQKL